MRNSWTDERLDDGFDRVGADIQSLRLELRQENDARGQETGALRKELHLEVGALRRELHLEVGALREEIQAEGGLPRGEMNTFRLETNARFGHLESRFDDLQRTLLQLGGGVIFALIGLIATQL